MPTLKLRFAAFALLPSLAAVPTPRRAAEPIVLPIEVVNNHVYLKVRVAGQDLDFIFDTGAGGSYLDLNTAERIGLKVSGNGSASGAGPGTVRVGTLARTTLEFPGTSLTHPTSIAIDL